MAKNDQQKLDDAKETLATAVLAAKELLEKAEAKASMNKELDNPTVRQVAILKEFSEIRLLLQANTLETASIRASVDEIKKQIEQIKNLYVTHTEFKVLSDNDGDKERRLRNIESVVWKFIGALTISQIIILPTVLYLFFKSLK